MMRTLIALAAAIVVIATPAAPQTYEAPLQLVFAQNEVALTNGDRAQLDRVVQAAADRSVVVAGHADSAETNAFNLSGQRANLVRDYLVSVGVAASSITVHQYGAERPAGQPNLAYNRRVEIHLSEPSGW